MDFPSQWSVWFVGGQDAEQQEKTAGVGGRECFDQVECTLSFVEKYTKNSISRFHYEQSIQVK